MPLQRLIVDDVDDGSGMLFMECDSSRMLDAKRTLSQKWDTDVYADWDESCESSELLEVNPGVTLHTTE